MLCTTFNAESNRYIDLKKMMYRQEQFISLTSLLSWFKLDRKCIYVISPQVSNNPSVAKTWTLNRLGKSIWSYYWHFLSNLNNTRKTLVKPATGWGRRHVSAMYTCGVWQTARSKLLRIHCALYDFNTGLKLENYYFFTFTFSRPEVRKLLLFYVFIFSRPEVRKLFRIYFFTFSRPEVRKLFRIYFFTFSRPEVRKLFRIYVFTFSRPEVGKLFHISKA